MPAVAVAVGAAAAGYGAVAGTAALVGISTASFISTFSFTAAFISGVTGTAVEFRGATYLSRRGDR
jgi:hypothetical protein